MNKFVRKIKNSAKNVINKFKENPLIPIKDYFAKIYISYYPYEKEDFFDDGLKSLLSSFPVLYLNRGLYDENIAQLQSESNTWSGVVIDDWGEDLFELNFSDVVGSFSRYEIEASKNALSNLLLPNYVKSYNGMEDIVKRGLRIFPQQLNPIYQLNQYKQWNDFINSGENLLRQLIMFYRHNGILFDEDGMPVITGSIIIETNYGIKQNTPSIAGELAARSVPNVVRDNITTTAGAGVGQVVNRGINALADSNAIKYLEYKKYAVPMSIYKGKITGLNFSFKDPYHFEGSFRFVGIQRKYIIGATEGWTSKRPRESVDKMQNIEFDGVKIVEPFGVTRKDK